MGQPVATRGAGKEFLPVVNVRGKVGSTFTGKLVGKREADLGFGKTPVYEFEALDGDMAVQRKNMQKQWVDVDDVGEGDHVEIIAGTRLRFAFEQLSPGVIVTIKYLGEGERPKRGGNKPHEYSVEIG